MAPKVTPLSVCGNRVLERGEACDDGNTLSGDGCTRTCLRELTQVASGQICGDGKIDPGEECDDGNRTDGDGCGSLCRIERSAAQEPNQVAGGFAQTGFPQQTVQYQNLPQNEQSIVFPTAAQPSTSRTPGVLTNVLGAQNILFANPMQQAQQPAGAQLGTLWPTVPGTQTMQPFAYNPFALQATLLRSQAPIGDTGPAAVVAIAAGAAAGIGLARRRRRQ